MSSNQKVVSRGLLGIQWLPSGLNQFPFGGFLGPYKGGDVPVWAGINGYFTQTPDYNFQTGPQGMGHGSLIFATLFVLPSTPYPVTPPFIPDSILDDERSIWKYYFPGGGGRR